MTGRAAPSVVALIALMIAIAPLQAEPTEIYRRAELTETRTGVVDVRVVFGPRLDIPVDCDEGFFVCREEVSFARLYALDFALETRSVVEGTPRTEREDRGSVFLALQFDAEDQELFDDELREYLASLGADVFEADYARLDRSEPIITIPGRSVTPSLSCFRNGDSGKIVEHDREVGIGPDGEEYVKDNRTHTWNLSKHWEPLCDEMIEATRDAYPDEIRTLPVPRKIEELKVHLVERNTVRDVAYVEELTPLPEGSSFTRTIFSKDDPGGSSVSTAGSGSSAKASWIVQKERWTSSLVEADISPNAVQRNAWLTRWELETAERSFGPDPVDRVLSASTLTMALLATLPPVRVDQNDVPIPVNAPIEKVMIGLDEDAFLAELGKRLDQQKELNAATLEKVLKNMPAGLNSPGWILVICRPDGSAEYGIPGTSTSTAMVRLTNADLFCAAVEAQLE